uniref:Anaphase-promoting complex subunit 5 n=1 Tax=Caenorhabditis japonica TaxID=281687 RepID=A0A8R1DR64_CAEJA
MLSSPFVSSTTISSSNSIRIDVDIEEYRHSQKISSTIKDREEAPRNVGFCETTMKLFTGLFVMMALRPVVKRSYLNLDAIFGHVFSNLTGEPITPTKVATFYLLQVLFETHFGKKDAKSKRPFTCQEKNKVFQHLYGLMTLEHEIPYKSYRDVVRMAFGTDRDIAYNFYACMEKLGQGVADINLNVPDEFYTNRHARDLNQPATDPYFDEYNQSKTLAFSSSQSFMYRWLKRILAEYSKMNQTQKFDLNTATQQWILSYRGEIFLPGPPSSHLPTFIDCSLRARSWVAENLYLLQKNPRHAFTYENMLDLARVVEDRHKDVFEAHLLEAAVHVQLQNPPAAVRAMKAFFDRSMFELNENMVHASRTHRLAVPSQMPLLYAPILTARIYRLFGDLPTARHLLRESMQQAQLKGDEICHQMGHLEMHIVEIIGSNPLLEGLAEDHPNYNESDRRLRRKILRTIDDLQQSIGPLGLPCCSQTEDDFEVCAEMDSMTKMMLMLRNISQGVYQLQYDDCTETGLRCPTGHDYEERGRKMEGYGYSIMTSNLIRNGMYAQAKTAAEEMIVCNFIIDPNPENFETETWAVGTVNLAYSHAGLGEYEKALDLLEEAGFTYSDDLSWQCNRHVVIATAIINFEREFLRNNYKGCEDAISDLRSHSELEYTLRRALIVSALGRDTEGIVMLKRLKVVDVRGKIRIHMQVASFYTVLREYERANLELIEAAKLANVTTLKDIRAMIRRRKATIMCIQEKNEEALKLLHSCYAEIMKYGSFTEKAVFYITAARAHRMVDRDPRIWLKHARCLVRKGQWPSMEKLILSEAAALHAPDGMYPDEDKVSKIREMFGKIAANYPGRCEWLLI